MIVDLRFIMNYEFENTAVNALSEKEWTGKYRFTI